MFLLAHPHLLWLLPLAAFATAWGWRGRTATPGRRPAVAACRAAALTALLLAAAGPAWVGRSDAVTRVMVQDVGPFAAPLPQDAPAGSDADQTHWVAVGGRAAPVIGPATTDAAVRASRASLDDDAAGVALADALRLAGGLVPKGGRGEVVLATPALATRGDAVAEADRLASRGVAVAVLPVAGRSSPLLAGVDAPPLAVAGGRVRVVVRFRAAVSGGVEVASQVGDAPVTRTRAAAVVGDNAVACDVAVPGPGAWPVRAGLGPQTPLVVTGATEVRPAPRALLVRRTGASAASADALAAVLGDDVMLQATTPADLAARLPATPPAAVVLDDVPAADLPPAVQQWLSGVVARGTGLLVTGAAHAFGPGGYADAPALAGLLPVEMKQDAEHVEPGVAVVMVVDTSGSMDRLGRLDLAKEVARLVVSHLSPADQCGIIEFYSGMRWATPLRTVSDRDALQRVINRFKAGEDNVLFPAVEEAYFALRGTAARAKHVIILSDGDVENAPFTALTTRMAAEGIAVSTVACADVQARPFLPNIALSGRGKFYAVPDAFAIPDIRLSEPQDPRQPQYVAAPTNVRFGEGPAARQAGDAALPAVRGYVRTTAMPTAEVVLSAGPRHDPLLARWRRGAGWVATLPLTPGSAEVAALQDAPAFRAAMNTVVADLVRGRPAEPLVVRADVAPAGVRLTATRADPPDGFETAGLHVRVREGDRNEAVRDIVLPPAGRGVWTGLLAGLPPGMYCVEAAAQSADAAAGTAAFAVASPDDVPAAGPPSASLARTANGVDGWFDTPSIDLRPAAVLAAIVAIVGTVAVRRWPARRASA